LAQAKQAGGCYEDPNTFSHTSPNPLIQPRHEMDGTRQAIRVRCGWWPDDLARVLRFTGVIFDCEVGGQRARIAPRLLVLFGETWRPSPEACFAIWLYCKIRMKEAPAVFWPAK
jgi:hypothetical protein